ncbi:MAG: hypothetical protein KatS3mg111_3884 [Pirellulaceae bacterium]|nr:MAG: hypothetical protein KatS3mg111_3884 [Pirellulaceae bacterium]
MKAYGTAATTLLRSVSGLIPCSTITVQPSLQAIVVELQRPGGFRDAVPASDLTCQIPEFIWTPAASRLRPPPLPERLHSLLEKTIVRCSRIVRCGETIVRCSRIVRRSKTLVRCSRIVRCSKLFQGTELLSARGSDPPPAYPFPKIASHTLTANSHAFQPSALSNPARFQYQHAAQASVFFQYQHAAQASVVQNAFCQGAVQIGRLVE